MFNGFISTTTPQPSPARKKAKIQQHHDFPLLVQAIGHVWLEENLEAVDCLINLCQQDNNQLSSDELQLITRLFGTLSYRLKYERQYEVLEQLQQVGHFLIKSENNVEYIQCIINENTSFLENNQEKIKPLAQLSISNASIMLAQAVGFFELGDCDTYKKGIAKLNEFCALTNQTLTSAQQKTLVDIYNRFSKSVFYLNDIKIFKEFQAFFRKLSLAAPAIRQGINENYLEKDRSLKYLELGMLCSQGQYTDAVFYFTEIYHYIPKRELQEYYMLLSDHAGNALAKLQQIATDHINSQDSEYLTKYYYKQSIVDKDNRVKCLMALKNCAKYAKESSNTVRLIHTCLITIKKLMNTSEFNAYKQTLINDFYFGIIDDDCRTVEEWTYFDYRNHYPPTWILIHKAVSEEIIKFKEKLISQELFTQHMSYMLSIIKATRNNINECHNFYDNVNLYNFDIQHPDFLEKFEQLILNNIPENSHSGTLKIVKHIENSPTVTDQSSSTDTSMTSAASMTQTKLSQ